MRAHGVPNFPDPRKGSGGEGFSISRSVGGGNAPPPISESQKQAAIANADCMRHSVVPEFPDPALAGGPTKIRAPVLSSPAFQHAVKVCHVANAHIGPEVLRFPPL